MVDTKNEVIIIPKHQVMAYARLIFPEIQKYFESEEGQKEFAEFMAEQPEQKDGAV